MKRKVLQIDLILLLTQLHKTGSGPELSKTQVKRLLKDGAVEKFGVNGEHYTCVAPLQWIEPNWVIKYGKKGFIRITA